MKDFCAFTECKISINEIIRVYRKIDRKWVRNVHIARDCEGLLFFVKGGIHYDFDGFSFDAHAGDVLRLPSGIPYGGTKIGDEENDFFVIDFISGEKDEFLNFPIPLAYSVLDPQKTADMFARAEKAWQSREPFYKIEVGKAILSILHDTASEYMHRSQGIRTGKADGIRGYINENSDKPNLDSADIAKHFYISETHLRRIFIKEFDISPMKYLSDLRIEKAKKLLLTSDMTVCEIADACGFGSVYYFSSAFKKKAGLAALAYRKEMREKYFLE